MTLKLKSLADLPAPPEARPVTYPAVSGGPFNLDWVFTFGKYAKQHAALGGVIEADPTYVQWCLENVLGFTISETAQEALAWALDE